MEIIEEHQKRPLQNCGFFSESISTRAQVPTKHLHSYIVIYIFPLFFLYIFGLKQKIHNNFHVFNLQPSGSQKWIFNRLVNGRLQEDAAAIYLGFGSQQSQRETQAARKENEGAFMDGLEGWTAGSYVLCMVFWWPCIS